MVDGQPIHHEIYQKIAKRYAEAVKTKDFNAYIERPAIRALVDDLTGQRVLDAGCGPGTNIQWLLDQGASAVVGVDASSNMIAIAEQRAGDHVMLHIADMSQPMTFLESANFDLVFSSLAVHYIEDFVALFSEFARLLRPGGHFIFSTGHPHSDHEYFGGDYFETRLVQDQWSGFADEPIDITFYVRPLSSITEALAQAGFVIERLTEARIVPEYQQIDPENYQKLLSRMSFICVRARKD